ncbi:MAG: DeoR/GlpR transcriptional regulator [Gluconacetobacter diazotrophicus]|nr:DeoR/GlpR transcriptional regulator [Gluconacetobacter diazotrophicus]
MPDDLPFARRDAIARRLSGGRPVVAASLADEFGVSEDAIRRDLRALASEGRCRRVYGGALPIPSPSMAVRMELDRDRKRSLARVAASELTGGELVFLDSGSTNLAMVELLPGEASLTVVTNAVDIAAAASRRPDLRLIMIGGVVDPTVGGCVDGSALLAVSRMRFDRAFLGACSVSAIGGARAERFEDATFKRAVLAAARNSVVLATAEKFAGDAPHAVAALSELDSLVLERPQSSGGDHAAWVDALRAAGRPRLLFADPT